MAEPIITGNMKIFNDGLEASGYLIQLAKIVELICGLCFVSGKFMKLSPIVLLPISLNIFLILIIMNPSEVGVGAFLFLGNLFLMYTNWDSYKGLFVA